MEDNETIHDRMLKNINNKFDKTRGSFFYDATKPAAIEFESSNKEIQKVASKLDVENLFGEELEKFINQRTGIVRKPATKATTKVNIFGEEGAEIRKGDLVATDNINFVSIEGKAVEESRTINVLVECETPGAIGNVPANSIKYFPVTIPGLTSVANEETVLNGYNAESDTELRNRYYERIRTPATSGNKYHYLQWAKEVTGVGDAKVISLWDGPGTVKVVIVDGNKKPATEELITSAHNYIEDNRPIGATVTVGSAKAKGINITVKVSLAEGYRIQLVQDEFKKALERYRKDIAFKDSYISYAAIGNILFTIDGILDYTDLKLNGAMKNIALKSEEIPIFGLVELEVM